MKPLLAMLGIVLVVAGCSGSVAPGIRVQIAEDFEAGKLKPDAQGVIRLPAELIEASIDGRAFVTTNQSMDVWLLLRSWRGKGGNLTGYLYAPGAPLTVGSEVPLITDAAGVVVSAHCTVQKSIGASWYLVHRDHD